MNILKMIAVSLCLLVTVPTIANAHGPHPLSYKVVIFQEKLLAVNNKRVNWLVVNQIGMLFGYTDLPEKVNGHWPEYSWSTKGQYRLSLVGEFNFTAEPVKVERAVIRLKMEKENGN